MHLKDAVKTAMPDGLLMAQLVLRRAAAWQASGLIFIHVPKNGGTSINAALYGRFMGHYRVRDIERTRPHLMGALPSLAVTRNPWARTYSAWNFARKGKAMCDGAQIRNAARYQGIDFSSFERFVLEWLPAQNLERADYVFRPQNHFLLTGQGAMGVSHLGQIEQPESYLPFLEKTLGRRVHVGHRNQSAHWAYPAHYRQAYTAAMRDCVAQVYAGDLARFGYEF